MSRDQVEAIIGKPRREASALGMYGTMVGGRGGPICAYDEEWVSRLGKIVIYFDKHDIVVHATFLNPPESGWLDRALKFMTR